MTLADSSIARRLADGAKVDDVAAAFGVPRKDVMDAGFDHGLRYVEGRDVFELTDKARTMLRSAPAPAPKRGPITVGLACPDPKVRRAAEKARDAVDRLRDLLAQWEDRAAARAEVERLETELAAAKARLTGRPAAPATDRAPDNSEVRAWAEAAGVPCPARGRIPGTVRDAYDAAHTGAAS